MEESYLLHIPLKYYSDVIKIEPGSFELAGKTFSFENIVKSTILKVSEFETKEEAEKFARKLKGVLFHTSVFHVLSLRGAFSFEEPYFYDTPKDLTEQPGYKEMHKDRESIKSYGIYDINTPSILPKTMKLQGMGVNTPKVEISYKDENLFKAFKEGFELEYPERILENPKLKLAIEFYTERQFSKANIINQFTVLEILIDRENESEDIIDAIDDIKRYVKNMFQNFQNKKEQRLYDIIESKLENDKEKNISKSLRELVANEAEAIGSSEKELKDFIRKAYNMRSKLVHEGTADVKQVNQISSRLDVIVNRVLRQHIIRAAST